MSLLNRTLLALLGGIAVAASGGAQSSPTLFHNGRIVLNDEKGTVAEALLAANGKVVATGTFAALSARPDARNAVLEDLNKAVAVPGLQDAHCDLAAFMRNVDAVDLTSATSYEDVIARVKKRAQETKEGAWIRGFGWNETKWTTPELPHHFELSSAVPKNPVFLERAGGGVVLVNAAALALARLDGVFDVERKVPGGLIVMDEGKHATGILLDTAREVVESVIPEPDPATRVKQFQAAQNALLSHGITCVHDMGMTRPMLAFLDDMRRQGKLAVRVVGYLNLPAKFTTETLAGFPRAPDPLDMLSVPGVHIVIDGSLDTRGAALVDDYSDEKGARGRLVLTEEGLNLRLAAVARAGLQPAVQAVGDRANRMVLDAFSRMVVAVPGFRDLRPRVEVALVVTPKDWARFPELGVIPSMQPAHAASDLPWVPFRLGAERTRGAYAWRALAPELGRLAFGSDFPYESPDALRGMHAARTRQTTRVGDDPIVVDQRLDGASALAGFTSGAAYAAFQDDRRGQLDAGYACDMTVLTVDPVRAEPEALLKGAVRATVINGQVVWRAR